MDKLKFTAEEKETAFVRAAAGVTFAMESLKNMIAYQSQYNVTREEMSAYFKLKLAYSRLSECVDNLIAERTE